MYLITIYRMLGGKSRRTNKQGKKRGALGRWGVGLRLQSGDIWAATTKVTLEQKSGVGEGMSLLGIPAQYTWKRKEH